MGKYEETKVDCHGSREGKLQDHIDSNEFGNGKLALVAYNTAWVARIPDEYNNAKFDTSIEYLRKHQYSNGSWGASYPLSVFDRIITTLMVVITLKQWGMYEDDILIEKGLKYLNENFKYLKKYSGIKDQMTSGFEVLLPMLVDQARKLGIVCVVEDIIQPYLEEKKNKMNKMKASKTTNQITSNKSWHFVLEAFGELYPVEKLKNLVKDNALIASSYCSTAYALYRGMKSEESVKHLERIVDENGGGVPSLFKVEIFDLAWSLNSLIFSGYPIKHKSLSRHLDRLEAIWGKTNGIIGAAIGSPEDSDDTANCLLALKKSDRLTNEENALDKLFLFLHQDYFITYEGERDPSLSSNLNCLITLKEFVSYDNVAHIVKRVGDWTKAFIIKRDYNFNDKWHMSKYYGMGRALIAFVEIDFEFSRQILGLFNIEQRVDGGWGAFEKSTRLETSYAVLAIIYCLKIYPNLMNAGIIQSLELAKKFMDECKDDEQGYKFWIEKYLYCPFNVDKMSILSANYALEKFDLNFYLTDKV